MEAEHTEKLKAMMKILADMQMNLAKISLSLNDIAASLKTLSLAGWENHPEYK